MTESINIVVQQHHQAAPLHRFVDSSSPILMFGVMEVVAAGLAVPGVCWSSLMSCLGMAPPHSVAKDFHQLNLLHLIKIDGIVPTSLDSSSSLERFMDCRRMRPWVAMRGNDGGAIIVPSIVVDQCRCSKLIVDCLFSVITWMVIHISLV
jgi:hypothetical protein